MKLKIILVLLSVLFSTYTFAQVNAPFLNEIQAFKQKDQQSMPASGGVLFLGSSSIRKWENLEEVFKNYHAINRGFGGSQLNDAIYYADDIIFPYHPSQIIIYSGENDIAAGVDPETVSDRFKILFNLIRKKMPEVSISFISLKPSISREKFSPQFIYTNELIKSFISNQQNAHYIDVYQPMISDKEFKEMFLEDKLHMNQKGYDIWTKSITPYLKKNNLK
ncbi:MAG: hypothetical protein IE931_10835 [Sphingobacteriales bacterium]|nr:hypothetical protein [Sphingobacteriales bacterium]